MTVEEIDREISELDAKRDKLKLEKREHEMKLLAIKTILRTGGRMPDQKYRQCCDSQKSHVMQFSRIEGDLQAAKTRRRELFRMRDLVVPRSDPTSYPTYVSDPSRRKDDTLSELVKIRQHYQEFSADGTRISSMRQMASEFVLKLNPVISSLINS